ncbi:hypothetical protein CC78DRAFT_169316 [Lojkania enalia]|uniref:Uncharacterized protein n=1 Tax=Lojkania enalia TaxID=147567 RepID=A0A9P4KGZ6_9PLEO|nr:hypothetical protein CC78DRAFT_169316 [Didymosphaeria enalia]
MPFACLVVSHESMYERLWLTQLAIPLLGEQTCGWGRERNRRKERIHTSLHVCPGPHMRPAAQYVHGLYWMNRDAGTDRRGKRAGKNCGERVAANTPCMYVLYIEGQLHSPNFSRHEQVAAVRVLDPIHLPGVRYTADQAPIDDNSKKAEGLGNRVERVGEKTARSISKRPCTVHDTIPSTRSH